MQAIPLQQYVDDGFPGDAELDSLGSTNARDIERRIWQLVTTGLLIAVVVLLALLLAEEPHCCGGGGGDGLFNGSVSILDQPIAVEIDGLFPENCSVDTAQCVVFPDDAPPINVEIVGVGGGDGGQCLQNESLCVSLATDSAPLDVNLVNANCTMDIIVNVTVDPVTQLEIISPLGSQPVVDSVSVTLASDHPPIAVEVLNDTLSVSLDGAVVQTELVGPFGGECTLNESLCVSLATDSAPLVVEMLNDTLTVTLDGEVVQTELVGPFGGDCSLNQSLCVSLVTDQAPLVVEVLNDTLTVTLDGEVVQTELVGPFGGECTLNESLCVSLATDSAPLDVNVVSGNCTIDVHANVTIDPVTQLEISSPLGSQPVADSVSVTFASDQAPLNVQLNANQTDQFSRVRVSGAHSIFDVKLLNPQADPLNFDNQQVSGAGTTSTYLPARASIVLGVAATTAGHRVRQSLRRFNYQPGKQTTILMTLVVGDSPAGITKRWGYYDQSNGVFFEASDGLLYAVRRSSVTGLPVDTYVDITSVMPPGWSPNNGVIYGFDFVWLGVGEIQWYVYNNGYRQIVYTMDTPPTSVTMSNPNNPLRYEIINDGSGPAEGLECICATVQLEGGVSPIGWPNSMNRGSSLLSISTDGLMHSLLAVRLRDGYQYAEGFLSDWTLTSTSGNVVFLYEIRYRPTVAGPAMARWSARRCPACSAWNWSPTSVSSSPAAAGSTSPAIWSLARA